MRKTRAGDKHWGWSKHTHTFRDNLVRMYGASVTSSSPGVVFEKFAKARNDWHGTEVIGTFYCLYYLLLFVASFIFCRRMANQLENS